MSGGSRGIGLAIAVAAARAGANIVLLAKTAEPNPALPGTIHSAVAEIQAVGGRALAVVGDVRNERDVDAAVDAAVGAFGGIDICINNASALALAQTEDLSLKRFDLMQQVSVRGSFVLTRACAPHLRRSDHAHILTISPPLNLSNKWLAPHLGYTVAKYGMTILGLGFAAEFAEDGIASNCLWPESTIATAGLVNLMGGLEAAERARTPQIMADAAVEILSRPASSATGCCFLDVELLRRAGTHDLRRYGGGDWPDVDLFVDRSQASPPQQCPEESPNNVVDLGRRFAPPGHSDGKKET
jgi:NAD(P)-dependent dehydrogenase (short-subunit alcohol dehydrogenase family)